jgi:NADPH2:quinone reductase
MKAAYLDSFGPPSVLKFGELPMPVLKEREVLVKAGAASVNPVDTYLRAGLVKMDCPMPFIPGCDVAGTVAAIGADVSSLKVGDRVWASNQGLLGRQGTSAEYVAVHEDWLYHTPANATDEAAAANALVGITAWLGLVWKANVQPGETVLVSGGAGGVGSMAVQMAKALGAKVIAICGRTGDTAKAFGADVIVDYRSGNLLDDILQATNGQGVDVWYETQPPSDLERTIQCLRPDGRLIVMAGRAAKPIWPNGAFYTKNLSLYGFAMFNVKPAIQRRAADDMNRWMAGGQLKPHIGAKFPLEKLAEAHQLQEDNTIHKKGTLNGKIVIAI